MVVVVEGADLVGALASQAVVEAADPVGHDLLVMQLRGEPEEAEEAFQT